MIIAGFSIQDIRNIEQIRSRNGPGSANSHGMEACCQGVLSIASRQVVYGPHKSAKRVRVRLQTVISFATIQMVGNIGEAVQASGMGCLQDVITIITPKLVDSDR